MAVVDTITIGSDTFSVYALTLTNAEVETAAFWNGRLGAERTAWDAAVAAANDDDLRAIAMAADWIDRALTFGGDKTVATQPRSWPRDSADNGCTGDDVADGTTPDDIFYAQSWLAGAILADNAAAASSGQGSNTKRAKAGTAEIEFFRSTQGSSDDTRLPQVAHDYVKCYLDGFGSGGVSIPAATGTSQASSFGATDFDRSEPFA
jgi:hypothetical protein